MGTKRGGAHGGRTLTEEARRAQIVQAAIETVAELGYPYASFSRVAKRAGLSSTGMISYYFAGKSELIAEVMATIFRVAGEITVPRMERERTYRGKLRAYIESSFTFMERYPAHTMALIEIVIGSRFRDVAAMGPVEQAVASVDALVDCLNKGRSTGEFGEFDPLVMAIAIRGAIDNALRQHMFDPDIDLARCGREIAEIFDRCTRTDPPSESTGDSQP
ncbi:TetR family transcriptional regulator [Peterkaempfera bronchialis]|uniref:TetR family transcriptional regulator n=1 Tax=Peterkaempfera bronchialis TaxID=2126346 RepID=UPI003C2F9BB5